jgi:3-oxoacyl-(acyl-carrier-protein) synthase
MHTDIAITGLGAISACGKNVKEALKNFACGARNAGGVTLFESGLSYPVFEVKDFIPPDNNAMRTLNLAFQAALEAITDAGLLDGFGDARVGVCLGTTVASQLNDLDFYSQYRKKGSADFNPAEKFLKSNLSDAVARFFKIKPCLSLTIVNACSSGTDAIGVGLSWLRNNYCDIAICGGADELNRIPLDGFGALGVVSKDLCAPFDLKRNGLNLGEGAGVVILENHKTYRGRSRAPRVFLKGYGSAADAYHLTAPRPDGSGLERALSRALGEAEILPEDVDFINAHGTATRDNDLVEGKVLGKVFGRKARFISTKGFTGHTLGAAGGLEAVFSVLGLREGWIPASPGFNDFDPDIGCSPLGIKTEVSKKYAVSTSLAFGGNNSALVIARN